MRVKFWDDRWADGQVLKENFSRLYMISQCKDDMVGDLTNWGQSRSGGSPSWNLGWCRERFVWKKYEEEKILTTISKVHWGTEGQNRKVWAEDDQEVYTVKSGYKVLNKEDQMQTSKVFKLLWNLKIAPSALVHAWRLLLDKLPTRINLVKRGMQLMNMLCPLCQEGVKTSQHLFGTCKVAQKVWDQCDRWVGNAIVRHESPIIHFLSFYTIGLWQCTNNAWKGMWVAIVLKIWNHKKYYMKKILSVTK